MSEGFIEIANGGTTARINRQTGQLFSLQRKGIEVMWKGGAPEELRPKDGWQSSSPVMFPVVGRAPDDTIFVAGKPCKMVQHGIARDLDWEAFATKTSVTLVQTYEAGQEVSSKRGISTFPRSYRLTQTYILGSDGKLRYGVSVENLSDESMPFALGWHSAFALSESGVVTGDSSRIPVPVDYVRASEESVIVYGESDAIIYRTREFVLTIRHSFGKAQLWNKEGMQCIALELITARSLSRSPMRQADLASQDGYREISRGKEANFFALISIRTEKPEPAQNA